MWCKTISVTQLRRLEWFHFVCLCPSLSLRCQAMFYKSHTFKACHSLLVGGRVTNFASDNVTRLLFRGMRGGQLPQNCQMERKRSVQEMKNDVEVWEYNQLTFGIQTNVNRRPNIILENVPRSIILTITFYEVAASIRSIRHTWMSAILYLLHIPLW